LCHFFPGAAVTGLLTSLRGRIIIAITLVHAVLMSLFVFDLVSRQRAFLHREQIERTLSLIQGLARTSTSWVLASDVSGLQEQLRGVSDYPDLRYAMVVDQDGKVLAHTDHRLVGRTVADAVSLSLNTAPPEPRVLVDSARVIDVAAPVLEQGRLIGWARLGIGQERSHRALQAVTLNGGFYILGAILIGVLFAVLLARSLTGGLYRLLEVAEAVRSGRRDMRAEVEPGEVGRVAASFNGMLDTLSESERELRQTSRTLIHLNETLERRVGERTADLAAANEEVRNFAYIVSHDLRAPLVNIQGFCGELGLGVRELRKILDEPGEAVPAATRRRIQAILADDIDEAMAFIHRATIRMDRQINAILTLSRLGRQTLRPETVDLGEVAGSVVALHLHEIETAGGTVTIDPLPTVVADRLSLEQIVGNLVSNAIKYRVAGRPPVLSLSADRSVDGVTLHVRDNGRGIAPGDIQRAFELFRRVGVQDTVGEGMGLPYVQTLVRRHQGRLWCESVPGEGTTFHVFLPDPAFLPGSQDSRPTAQE